jgi:16S rRNA (guanine527-N7)-methyltransferase
LSALGLFNTKYGTLVDIGTGGGFPAIPLGIHLDGWKIHMVESKQRKCDFLQRAIETLNLESRMTVHCMPVEEALNLREIADVVTCRAVAAAPTSLELCAPLARNGGTVALWATATQSVPDVPPAIAHELGVKPTAEIVSTPGTDREQAVLALWRKIGSTGDRFPRRVGVARKRPLWN